MENEISSIEQLSLSVKRTEEQLESVLIIQTKTLEMIENLRKDMLMLSYGQNICNSTTKMISANIGDKEITIDKIEDMMEEVHQTVATIPNEFIQLRESLQNARVIRQQMGYDSLSY